MTKRKNVTRVCLVADIEMPFERDEERAEIEAHLSMVTHVFSGTPEEVAAQIRALGDPNVEDDA